MDEKFQGNDNYGKPKKDYLDKLSKLSDEELFTECKDKIWLSAYANNNPRSDYHWQVDACMLESDKRHKKAEEKSIYQEAFDKLYKEMFG